MFNLGRNRMVKINKFDTDAGELANLKKDFYAYTVGRMGVRGFDTLVEDLDNVYLPVPYIEKKYGVSGVINGMKLIGKLESKCMFKGKLRSNQQEVFEKTKKVLLSRGGCCLEIQTGFGKTVTALALASVISAKVLIVVPGKKLATQWWDEIRKYIGFDSDGCVEELLSEKFDVLIINTVAKMSPRELHKYGFVVFDEVHRYTSNVFFNGIANISAKYILAMTATINREDGFDSVLQNYIGEVVMKINNAYTGATPHVTIHKYYNKKYSTPIINQTTGGLDMSAMQTQLFSDPDRLQLVIDILKKNIDRATQVMVVVAFTETANTLMSMAMNDKKLSSLPMSVLYHGKPLDKTSKIVFATRNSGGVGIDIKDLDMLVLATTFKPGKYALGLTQVIGRILRKPHKNHPLVFDIVDCHSFYKKHGLDRIKWYQQKGYKVMGTDGKTIAKI